jgi:small-conductance mechanosensitive channel
MRALQALAIALMLAFGAAGQAQEVEPPPAKAEEAPAALPLASPDEEIAARLAGIYAQVEGLEGIRTQVSGGVVNLQGTTLTAADRSKAQAIAERLTGVVSVENELAVEHRVSRRLDPVVERTREIARSVLAFLPLLLVALAVFLVFWFAGKLLTRSTSLFRKLAPNPFIEALIEQVIRLGFIVAGLVAAMSILGATALLGSVLGAAGLFGLAIGFAVRDTIENYIASILLSIRQPFAPNDHVIIEGYEGKITVLNSRATVITTLDGNEVRIPNATVYKANITNFSRSPERRFEFEIGIGYENDLTCALALALSTAKGVAGVLQEPGPFVIVDRLDAYAIAIKVFGWADQVKSDYAKVKSETIRQVKEAFQAAGISIPEPIQNVRRIADTADAGPAAAAPQPTQAALREIRDTGADDTLTRKVSAIRSTSETDLLSRGGAKE